MESVTLKKLTSGKAVLESLNSNADDLSPRNYNWLNFEVGSTITSLRLDNLRNMINIYKNTFLSNKEKDIGCMFDTLDKKMDSINNYVKNKPNVLLVIARFVFFLLLKHAYHKS